MSEKIFSVVTEKGKRRKKGDCLMDLYAYCQIDELRGDIEDILEHIPRLRGIRKMSEEELQENEENEPQLERFNHYVGQEGVYMIHARIGGAGPNSNWEYFGGPEKVASQPWFLEKVDDWDTTYCDIYVTTNYEKESKDDNEVTE